MERYKEMAFWLPDVGKGVQSSLDSFGNYAVAHSDVIQVALVISVSALVMLLALRYSNNRKPSDEAEDMRKRLELDAKYADAFGDKLFDMLCNDEIDRHEYKRACRRFGIAYRLNDLLTRKNPKRGLKFRVLHHIKEIHDTVPTRARNGEPRFFGPHPSKDYPATLLDIKPVPQQRKVWIVAGKALLRRKSAD